MERNGIDTDLLEGFVAMMGEQPDGGVVHARTRHRWDTGFAIDGSAEELSQFGQVQPRQHHTYRTDWPAPLSEDSGPTPGAEGLLAAVGSCVATTYVAHAARLGVTIDALEVTAEGRFDLHRLFEIDPAAPGVRGISLTIRVSADADDRTLEALGVRSSRTSPAFAALAMPVPLSIEVERVA
jgi:uncharacterized OsmC-like protein